MSYGNGQYDGGGQYDTSGPITGNGQYDAGGVWDGVAQGPYWVVGGYRLPVRGVTLTPTTLTLDIANRGAATRRALREFEADAGALDRRERADGVIQHVDLAGGDNTYRVAPSIRHRPPRVVRDWLVEGVNRDRASADTKAILGSVSLRGKESRAAVAGLADTQGSDDWAFAFESGTLATPRVSNVRQEDDTTLQVILTPRQAELLESVAPATAGSVVNVVPDGQTFTRDTTPDGRQTVTVSPPSGVTDPTPSAGEYVVMSWRSEGADGGAYRVELTIDG